MHTQQTIPDPLFQQAYVACTEICNQHREGGVTYVTQCSNPMGQINYSELIAAATLQSYLGASVQSPEVYAV